MFVQCENTYLDKRPKDVFFDTLPANILGAVGMFWGRERDTHLLNVAQNPDTLLEQELQVPVPARVASYGIRGECEC